MTRERPMAQFPADGLPPVTIEHVADRIAAIFPDLHEPIYGYDAIARAVSKGLNMSCNILTAKRLSAMGRENRLPVWKWVVMNKVFMLPIHFQAWAQLALVPSGAAIPGTKPKRRGEPTKKRSVPAQTSALAALALAVIRDTPGCSQAQIAEELGVSSRALKQPLDVLRRTRPTKVTTTGRWPSLRYTAAPAPPPRRAKS